MKNKEILFKNSTELLMNQLDELNLETVQRMQARNLVLAFRDGFKKEHVKNAVFSELINTDYRFFPYDSYGFCRAASFSFREIMDCKDWELMYIDNIWTYGAHHYLRHKKTKIVFDLTFDQYLYDNITIPYELGRPVKMDPDGKNTMIRFLHSLGFDFKAILDKKQY